jgi:signal transduction histidine kinase
MELSIQKHRRILLLFLFGVGLPSLILGYLALRGIQSERALLEKRTLDEHRRIAELITGSLDKKISQVEQIVYLALRDQQEILQPDFSSLSASIKQQYPLIEAIFLFEYSEKIHLPSTNLLFLPSGSVQSVSNQQLKPSLERKIREGQQSEFQQQNYRKALISYQKAFELASDRQVKGELLSAVARVQKKSSLFQDSIKSYEAIARDFNRVKTAHGIPLGVIARFELGSLLMTINNSLRSVETHLFLYKKMVQSEWALEKAQYEFFTSRIKESIEKILSSESGTPEIKPFRKTYEELKEKEKEKWERTERLLVFRENAGQNLLAKVAPRGVASGDSAMRFTLEIGKYNYLVSCLIPAEEQEKNPNQIWGLLLDANYLKDSLLAEELNQYVITEGSEWIVRGRGGQAILKSENAHPGSLTIKTNFLGNFPDWIIEFYEQERPFLKTFLFSRQGIYFYMFLLIGGILIFGLILTVRTITRELELAKMKSDFVSTISHEFKSPLTSIRQLSEMLHAGRVPSKERRQEYYDILLEQSERLSLLTDNVLNFAKMEEGRKEYDFELTDVDLLIKEIVASIQDRVRHDGYEIQMNIQESLPPVMVDGDALSQAINNLLDNAIKYSGKKKKVVVEAYTEGGSLAIAVKDFGVGIKKEELDKIFDRFYRGGEELTRSVRGSGLGLTLVKKIAEAHSSTVQVKSQPGKGSTFTITLPLTKTKDG